jgi:hypothetical protein
VTAAAEFQDAYRAWRSEPFPNGSVDDDDVDELHADLANVDDWVAGPVVTFFNHGEVVEPPGSAVRVFGALIELRGRARLLAVSAKGDGRSQAEKYERYVEHMELVYRAYLRAAGTA